MKKKVMEETDERLVRGMLDGMESAFVELYRRHQQSVYRFALHMSGSPAAAEDVTQEVFLALIQRPQEYREERGILRAFLFGIARNHVRRWLRSNRRIVAMDSVTERAAIEDPLEDVTQQVNVEAMRKWILSLPSKYREAVVLCDLHEMDYITAAQVLGCAIGTLRSRLHRGRSLLQDKLARSRVKKEETSEGTYELTAL